MEKPCGVVGVQVASALVCQEGALCSERFTACDSVRHQYVAYVDSVILVFLVHFTFRVIVSGYCPHEVLEDAFVGLVIEELGSEIVGVNVYERLLGMAI